MRQTDEQRTATDALRALAGPYRVTLDTEGWPMIPGRLGQIEHYDGVALAVFTDRRRMHAKILAIPGVQRHQQGDDELRVVFPAESLSLVASAVKARRKYVPSSSQLQNLAAGRRFAPAPVGASN